MSYMLDFFFGRRLTLLLLLMTFAITVRIGGVDSFEVRLDTSRRFFLSRGHGITEFGSLCFDTFDASRTLIRFNDSARLDYMEKIRV